MPAGFAATSVAARMEWPLKLRVKLNSPSLCPTMFSVTYTGMNFLPLCTAMVCPTISGTTVDRRDQVRRTFFSLREFMPSTRAIRKPSTNAPFLVERAIKCFQPQTNLVIPTAREVTRRNLLSPGSYFLPRRFTINLSVRLLFRVLYPRVGCPHGVTGCLPPEVLPSPPPCGWSTGFIDTPRLCGRLPSHRDRPALPIVTFSWSR